MKARYMLVAFATLTLALDAEEGKDDQKNLQGTWKVKSLVNDGKEVPADKIKNARLTFDGNRYTLRGGEEDFRGTFKLDPEKKPKHIDTVFLAEDEKERGRAQGIYELDGKRLRICWSQGNDARPKEFASKSDTGTRLMVMEKE
jgi:uncharacterized protein (TIGR03067 family)